MLFDFWWDILDIQEDEQSTRRGSSGTEYDDVDGNPIHDLDIKTSEPFLPPRPANLQGTKTLFSYAL